MGTAITAVTRPGFVDAQVSVLAVSGGVIAALPGGLDISQAGSGYKAGDVVTLSAGNADATLTVAAAGLTAGGVIVTSTTAAGVVY